MSPPRRLLMRVARDALGSTPLVGVEGAVLGGHHRVCHIVRQGGASTDCRLISANFPISVVPSA